MIFINSIDALILFIFKKNNELQLCVDYRKLNVVTKKNRCSLSFIDKTLNKLNKIKVFFKLNLKNIYYCVRIKIENY